MAETIRYDFGAGAPQTLLQGFEGTPAAGRFALNLAPGSDATVYVLQEGGPLTADLTADYAVTLGEGAFLRMVFVSLGGAAPMRHQLRP